MTTRSDTTPGAGAPKSPFEAPRKGPYKRLFAWVLSRLQEHYPEEIAGRKRALLGGLSGRVVEVGAGAGSNLEFFSSAADLLLVEPNGHLHEYLRKAADQHGAHFEIRGGTAEHMDVESASADFVVCTLALCSVDDQALAIAEVMRVLKPGGKFVFLEHVAAADGTRRRRWQRRLRGFWRGIGDGCTLDRETWKTIEQAGFVDIDMEHFESEGLSIVRPHIAGTATRG